MGGERTKKERGGETKSGRGLKKKKKKGDTGMAFELGKGEF